MIAWGELNNPGLQCSPGMTAKGRRLYKYSVDLHLGKGREGGWGQCREMQEFGQWVLRSECKLEYVLIITICTYIRTTD